MYILIPASEIFLTASILLITGGVTGSINFLTRSSRVLNENPTVQSLNFASMSTSRETKADFVRILILGCGSSTENFSSSRRVNL